MDEQPEADRPTRGQPQPFYVVWSPEGGNPVVRFEAFGAATSAAWKLSERHPGQSFFVLKSCWGRLARTPEAPAVDGEAGSIEEAGRGDDPTETSR